MQKRLFAFHATLISQKKLPGLPQKYVEFEQFENGIMNDRRYRGYNDFDIASIKPGISQATPVALIVTKQLPLPSNIHSLINVAT